MVYLANSLPDDTAINTSPLVITLVKLPLIDLQIFTSNDKLNINAISRIAIVMQ